jgi:DNA-binding transcriptional LysR family regulator
MDLRQLRYFLVLSEELNFTRAAARCNVSQPPLSRAISQLESELKATLFDRDTHRVSLTAAGRSLVDDAQRIMAGIEEAGDRVRGIARGLRGTLRLGFGGSALYSLWPKLVQGFRTVAPDVTIKFVSMPVIEQIEALREGRIDVGLIREPILDELLATQTVYSEPLALALPADHPLCATTGAIAIRRLAASRFVTYEPRRGFSYHADLSALCRIAGFDPIIAHEAASTEAVVGIVACGEGVAVVPASAERLRMHGVRFRPLEVSVPPQPFETVTFGLAWNKVSASSVAQEFIAHARDWSGSMDARQATVSLRSDT